MDSKPPSKTCLTRSWAENWTKFKRRLGRNSSKPDKMKDTEENDSSETLALSKANNFLAVNLHKELAREGKNVFFSPLSISTALAMMFCGSEGKTAKEMQQVLGYETANIKDEHLVDSFQYLLNAIENSPESYTLACANSVLSHYELSVKEEYKTLLQESFKALLLEVDFQNESAETVAQINEWVSDKTNKMIPQLLDSLDPSTVMVLLNAVYFKGSWLKKFEKNCPFSQHFYNNGVDEQEVDMMHLKKKLPYAKKETFQVLELPYKGGEIAMMVLLPIARDGLDQLEESISPNFIQELKKEMIEKTVTVALPKFKLEYSKSLKEKFQSLGMNRLFRLGAQFGGISDSKKLLISEIIHKAVLVVNEEGCEAAASTELEYVPLSMHYAPSTFIADHPFMFVIYNTLNRLILFMGRVNEL